MRTRSSVASRRGRGRGTCIAAACAALGLWALGGFAAYARLVRFVDRVKSWAPQSLRSRFLSKVAQRKLQEVTDGMSIEVEMSQAEVDVTDAQTAEVDEHDRLLQGLLGRVSGVDVQLAGTEEFMTQLRQKNPTQDPVVSPLLHDTWRVLNTTSLGLKSSAARVAWYSGGAFLHEGSILNGGLLKGVLKVFKENMGEARITLPSVSIRKEDMMASAMVSFPDGHMNISYTAELKPMPPTFLQLSVQALDIPDTMGHRTPLLDSMELMQVIYLDDMMLVWKDGFGNSEILVRESAMAQCC